MNSYFICATQPTNVGDLVINKMLIDELCRYGTVYVDACGLPSDFKNVLLQHANAVDVNEEQGITLKRIGLKNICKIISLIRKKKIKLLTQNPGPMGRLQIVTRFGFNIIYLIFKICGASVKRYGNCCSNAIATQTPVDRMLVDEYYLRSQASVEYAMGFCGSKRVHYIPDLAFLLHYYVGKPREKKNVIAFNVRLASDNELLKKASIDLINHCVSIGYSIEIYFQVHSDYEIAKEIYECVAAPQVKFHEEVVWYDDLDFYLDKRYVISNRLHSLLIGSVYGAIPIGLMENDPKLLKIKHVFESAFHGIQNLIYINSVTDFKQFDPGAFDMDIYRVVEDNSGLCRSIIRKSVGL